MTEAVIQIITSFLGTLGFSVLFNLRGKKLLLSSLGGMFAWTLYLMLEPAVPSEAVRYFFCSFFLAVYAEVLARLLRTPATTFLIPPMIPLIPGGALYHTMRYGLNREWSRCLSQAFYTLKLALALALGIIAVLSILGVISVLLNRSWYPPMPNYDEDDDEETTP